jgi:peptide/nickel transport system ATP-binding protein
LARAIVIPPKVLLCDEPTSALDVSLAANVLNLIARLRRELGMAVLFVTHDLAAARVVGDRIAVMYLGRIVEVGTAEAVTTDPAHPYTQALLSAVPHAGARPVALHGEPANASRAPSGCAFHPRCLRAESQCCTDDPPLVASEVYSRPVACWLASERPSARPSPLSADTRVGAAS